MQGCLGVEYINRVGFEEISSDSVDDFREVVLLSWKRCPAAEIISGIQVFVHKLALNVIISFYNEQHSHSSTLCLFFQLSDSSLTEPIIFL